MKYQTLLTLAFLSISLNTLGDTREEFSQRSAQSRAIYWLKKGHHFDARKMSVAMMDQRVAAIQRAAYWKKQGYHFNSKILSADMMDNSVRDLRRAAYWRKQGYHFDARSMTAGMMDDEAKTMRQGAHHKVTRQKIQHGRPKTNNPAKKVAQAPAHELTFTTPDPVITNQARAAVAAYSLATGFLTSFSSVMSDTNSAPRVTKIKSLPAYSKGTVSGRSILSFNNSKSKRLYPPYTPAPLAGPTYHPLLSSEEEDGENDDLDDDFFTTSLYRYSPVEKTSKRTDAPLLSLTPPNWFSNHLLGASRINNDAYRWSNGDSTTYGSYDLKCNTYRYSNGDSSTTCNDGRRINVTHYGNGDSTTRVSKGSASTTYDTYRWSNGDSSTRGSDGSTYNTSRYSNGDSTTRVRKLGVSTTYNTYRWSNGDSTTRGSDGSSYNTLRYSNGDTTTRGNDGSRIDVTRYSNGDSTTRIRRGASTTAYDTHRWSNEGSSIHGSDGATHNAHDFDASFPSVFENNNSIFSNFGE